MKFDQKYNHDTFLAFLRGFLPEDYVEKEKDIADLSRCKIIANARELGHSPSLGVYVLEMSHAKETDPRVSIATDAFKILATFGYDKALVIFKNDESENYRFSYLTISLDLNEKNKVIAKYSNARRYSFFLGEGAKTKTPEQQLVGRGRIIDTNDLLSRFSLEVVNKQFYLEVAKYFDELVSNEDNNLALPSVSQENINIRKSFAVRLIGRLMFCWFLKQKKSDFGQLIPNELLSSRVVSENYYHSILEPLFFEVLNTSIDTRGIRNELFDKVPYLNGGLFNPQYDDYYDLDRGTFISKHINTLRISDTWFREFFELLETYNFTIDENTVFDQELSVDPEMLGRIFENLLAEINPETGSSERKRTGSFYTPRQIVEYMVDQSLIEYLKTKTGLDEKKLSTLVSYDLADDAEYPLQDTEKQEIVNAIESLKLLDPACGSGAYPIGALQKIVYILQQIDPDCKLWLEQKLKDVPDLYKQKIINEVKANPFDYTRKLDVIKNSIFGVDIQPIAVDVSRLRCFLTLVVESEIDDAKSNRGIDPLPNLDFKFVCANSLIPAPEQPNLNEGSLFGDDFQEKFSMAVDRYFSSSGENKRSANNEIHKLIDSKVEEKLNHVNDLVSYNGDKKIESLRAKANRKQIDYHSKILTLWSSYKNIFENKPVGFFDPRYFFPSVKEGFDIVIGNPPYVSVKSISSDDKKLFSQLFETGKGRFNLFTLFLEKGQKLLKTSGVLSYILPEVLYTNSEYKYIRKYLLENTQILSISNFSERVFEASVDTSVIIVKNGYNQDSKIKVLVDLDSSVTTIKQAEIDDIILTKNSSDIKSILDKMNSGKDRLSNVIEVQQGIIYSGQRKEDVFSNEKVDDTYKKVLDGRDIHKYSINYDLKQENRYIRYTKKLHRPREERLFLAEEKLIFPRRSTSFMCTIDTEQFYLLNTAYTCLLKNSQYSLRYILGILNSRVIDFLYSKTYLGWQITIPAINSLPIPEVSQKNIKMVQKIEELIDQILLAKKGNLEVETKSLESQVDQLVYKLYELTPEEIQIVDEVK